MSDEVEKRLKEIERKVGYVGGIVITLFIAWAYFAIFLPTIQRWETDNVYVYLVQVAAPFVALIIAARMRKRLYENAVRWNDWKWWD